MRIAIVGGSLGGLLAAFALSRSGRHEVVVYERTPTALGDRGAGIRVQPVMVELLRSAGLDLDPLSTFTQRLRYVGHGPGLPWEEAELGQFTQWGLFYEALRTRTAAESVSHYLGHCVKGAHESAHAAVLTMTDDRQVEADLVVFADGTTSTGRQWVDPSARLEYSGYVAWRGYVTTDAVSRACFDLVRDATVYALSADSHMAFYPMPRRLGAGSHDEDPLINFIWYRNVRSGKDFETLTTTRAGRSAPISVHPGDVQEHLVAQLRADARRLLPTTAAEVVEQAPDPFIQPVYELESSRMRLGRFLLLGDASFLARPHAGAGTAKAAVNAFALADALNGDSYEKVSTALDVWELEQRTIGRRLVQRSRRMGEIYQRADEVVAPGARELQFGLYGPGR